LNSINIAGIDIGQKGAICTLPQFSCESLQRNDDKRLDVKWLYHFLLENKITHLAIERQFMNFKTIEEQGMCIAIAEMLSLNYTLTHPATWKSFFGIKSKPDAVELARAMFDDNIKDHNQADSVLIALHKLIKQ